RRAGWGRTAAARRTPSCDACGSVAGAPRLAPAVGPVPLRRGCCRRLGPEAEFLPHPCLDGDRHRGVLAQEVARVLASLAEALAVVGVPGARLLDDAVLGGDVEQLALLRDADAVQDVELDLLERRRDLVLHHLHLGAAADHLVPMLDGADAT